MLKEHAKPSTRRQDIIHPSEVAKTGWCPRSTQLRIERCRALGDPYWKPSESIGVQLLNIFDEGHYIHDKWQKRLRDMGDLWGKWECNQCSQFILDSLYPSECLKCSGTKFTYQEISLFNRGLLISGHADGGVPRLKSLIEIKSVGVGTARIEAPDIFKANTEGQKTDLSGLWRDIKEPFPAHVRQGQLYLFLCNEMGLDFDQIIFLYESKFNQGAKEFVVKYDYYVVLPLIERIVDIIDALDIGTTIECPFGGCKDCEIYGNETSNVGLGRTAIPTEPVQPKRIKSTSTTIGGSARSSKRIVRPT